MFVTFIGKNCNLMKKLHHDARSDAQKANGVLLKASCRRTLPKVGVANF